MLCDIPEFAISLYHFTLMIVAIIPALWLFSKSYAYMGADDDNQVSGFVSLFSSISIGMLMWYGILSVFEPIFCI